MKPAKNKACKVCGDTFQPFQTTQKVCGPKCAIDYAKSQALAKWEKLERAKHKADLERIKTRAQWLREAQQAFNAFVRERDKDLPCISCQRHHAGQYHAGHYKSVGGNPELRFCEDNNHKQCAPCNNHLSGNIVNYRPNLIEKIGQTLVDWLEGPHAQIKLSIEDIRAIKATYKAKLKELKNNS